MKTIVIFNSQTGFTRRYAEWIDEATGADFMELSLAKQKDLTAYEAVIFGGWACGGGIRNLSWFKKNMVNWQDKKLIVYCVGASPIENPQIEPALRHNFTDEEFKRVNVFYCPGGLNYGKMKAPSRLMMKMFLKTMTAKKNKTEMEREMIRMLSSSYDISDRKYIEPIIKCLAQ